MKGFVALILLLFTVGVAAATPEEKYFLLKDKFITEINKTPDDLSESNYTIEQEDLKKLEKNLLIIVKPLQIPGYDNSRINIDTLHSNEPGFNQIDGIRYFSKTKAGVIVVTSSSLLKLYAARNTLKSADIKVLSMNENFYSDVFDWDVGFIKFNDVPVKINSQTQFAKAEFMDISQDPGPFPPQSMIVMIEINDQILLWERPIGSTISPIKSCEESYSKDIQGAQQLFEQYRNSKLKDTDSLDRAHVIEEKAYANYKICFSEAIQKSKNWGYITREAQSMVDMLQNAQIK